MMEGYRQPWWIVAADSITPALMGKIEIHWPCINGKV
jgi:hypothetical protein